MGDDSTKRGRDHRLTSRPAEGSAPARAVTEGAPMLGVEDADFTDMPESAKALEAVPRGEFADITTDPIALDFKTQMALKEHRAKTTAVETRANLVLTNRLLEIIEKREADELESKRWTRTQVGRVVAGFTSGGAVAALIAAFARHC